MGCLFFNSGVYAIPVNCSGGSDPDSCRRITGCEWRSGGLYFGNTQPNPCPDPMPEDYVGKCVGGPSQAPSVLLSKCMPINYTSRPNTPFPKDWPRPQPKPFPPSTPKPKPSQPSTGGFPGRFEKCPPPVRVRVTSSPPIPSDFRCSPDARWQYHCRGRVVVVDGEVTISDNRPSVSFICRVSFDSVHCPVSGEHPKSDSVELRESSGGNWPMCKK